MTPSSLKPKGWLSITITVQLLYLSILISLKISSGTGFLTQEEAFNCTPTIGLEYFDKNLVAHSCSPSVTSYTKDLSRIKKPAQISKASSASISLLYELTTCGQTLSEM